jgi:putative metalloprotease
VKAITLSDKEVLAIAFKSAQLSDRKKRVAPSEDKYSKRLERLVDQKFHNGDVTFNYGVYISPEVNAFAMVNGTHI